MQSLLFRLRYGWSFVRMMYLGMGLALVYQSFQLQEWLAVAFGLYFASMGLFGFGCAGGACGIPNSTRSAFNDQT
ncbi:MAG: hypothetical protein FGM54_07275 [Chitinophagaceae bacterium]|nr:hypothetical protein [Chitinophagaceae bacterium]